MKQLFLSRTGATESYFGLDAVPVESGYVILGVGVSQFQATSDLFVSTWIWQRYKRGGLSPFEMRRLKDSNPAEFDAPREGWMVEVGR